MKLKWVVEIEIEDDAMTDAQARCLLSLAQDSFLDSFYTEDIEFRLVSDYAEVLP